MQALTDPRAWRADTLDSSRNWYDPLDPDSLACLDAAVRSIRRTPRPINEIRADEFSCHACRPLVDRVAAALESGRGFAIIEGWPADRYSREESQAAYWILGQMLARPFEQNVEGTLLYDVRDTGRDR